MRFLLQNSPLDNCVEIEGDKSVTVSLEKFVLKLDPVQTQRVQEALKHIHHQQDSNCHSSKNGVTKVNHHRVVGFNHTKHCLLPKHSRELRMCQRKRPQSQIRGRVRHHSKNELNRFDGLVNGNLTKVELSSMAVVVMATVPASHMVTVIRTVATATHLLKKRVSALNSVHLGIRDGNSFVSVTQVQRL